jgi:hypothetical protein
MMPGFETALARLLNPHDRETALARLLNPHDDRVSRRRWRASSTLTTTGFRDGAGAPPQPSQAGLLNPHERGRAIGA